MPTTYEEDGGGRIVLREHGGEWSATVRTTVHRAWLRAELTTAVTDAGFTDVEWTDPPASGYHQPVVTARRTKRG
jgi:hypothetical protein